MRPYSLARTRIRRRGPRLVLQNLEDRTVPALDPTFGVDGTQLIDFGSPYSPGDVGQDVVIQPDGKIVAAGQTLQSLQGYGTGLDFAVARLNTDGSLDTSFNGTGKQTIDFGAPLGEYGQSVALQPDGKILVAGYADFGSQGGGYECVVARLNTDGSLDQTFGIGGVETVDFQNPDIYWHDSVSSHYSVAAQGDKIVLAGTCQTLGIGYTFLVARLNNDGSLDTSFGAGGTQTAAFGSFESYAYDMAVRSDGKIVVGGYTYGGPSNSWDFAAARLTSDGALDTSFNGTGQQTIDFGGGYDNAHGVALQGDKILLAGFTFQNVANDRDFAVVRLNDDGSLDTTFNGTGQESIDFGTRFDWGWSVACRETRRSSLVSRIKATATKWWSLG